MFNLFILTAIVCTCGFISALIHDLPDGFPHCHRFDPEISQCLLKATEQVKPFLVKGIPELGVPPLEPFHVNEIILQQGTSALNFKATIKDIVVHGLQNYNFSKFDFDVPNIQWFCLATIDQMNLEGNYFVNGKILLAPIEGKGKFTAGISNADVYVHQKAKVILKKGVEYLKPYFTNTTIKVSGPQVKLQGLFGGNDRLNNVTNQVIANNVNELFEDLKPVFENIISDIIDQWIFKALLDNVPFDKLYLKER